MLNETEEMAKDILAKLEKEKNNKLKKEKLEKDLPELTVKIHSGEENLNQKINQLTKAEADLQALEKVLHADNI